MLRVHLSFPWLSPGLRFKKQVGVCSVLGLLSPEGPIQLRSCLALSSVAQPLPHSSVSPERPEHWKPNLKGSQRPGLQQSELENITIVPLET